MQKHTLALVLCFFVLGCAGGGVVPIKVPETAPSPEPVLPQADKENPVPEGPAPEGEGPIQPLPAPISERTQTTSFSEIPGWAEGDQTQALRAFQRSCHVFARKWDEARVWKEACERAQNTPLEQDVARRFFEDNFIPREDYAQNGEKGLLTAYYEPELEVRSTPVPGFDEPIFIRPDDLVTVDPKRFKATGFRGRKLMGRVVDGLLVPYFTRTEIKKKGGTALAWGSPAEVFFLQIQGSGRLRYEDGRVLRAGFAGHNGHAYTSIGRALIKEGELKPGRAGKGAIEKWMKNAGPQKTNDLMNRNKRYVFFAATPVLDPTLGPTGTQGAPLTAGASLAVDPALYPLGSPIWVDTRLPRNAKDWKGGATQFLAIAQDTGGAINGPARGDLFMGSGAQVGRLAGIVKHPARWWVLVPRAVIDGMAGPKP